MSHPQLDTMTVSLPCFLMQSSTAFTMMACLLSIASRWFLVRIGYTGSLLRLLSSTLERGPSLELCRDRSFCQVVSRSLCGVCVCVYVHACQERIRTGD